MTRCLSFSDDLKRGKLGEMAFLLFLASKGKLVSEVKDLRRQVYRGDIAIKAKGGIDICEVKTDWRMGDVVNEKGEVVKEGTGNLFIEMFHKCCDSGEEWGGWIYKSSPDWVAYVDGHGRKAYMYEGPLFKQVIARLGERLQPRSLPYPTKGTKGRSNYYTYGAPYGLTEFNHAYSTLADRDKKKRVRTGIPIPDEHWAEARTVLQVGECKTDNIEWIDLISTTGNAAKLSKRAREIMLEIIDANRNKGLEYGHAH